MTAPLRTGAPLGGVGFLLACVLLAPTRVLAALGDDAASVETDRVRLHAALRTAPQSAFTVQELQLDSGTLVKEYLNAAGQVFAVSWQGPALPNLRQLLGASFAIFRDAPRAPGSSRNHVTVEQPTLVVHSVGHPRYFAGLAYLPQWMPAGLSAAELR
jgi:hypothetical protein